MALILADRVRETSTTVSTGTLTLAGAVANFQSFAAIGNTNTTYYTIVNRSASEWEVGIGTYTTSGTTLSRDTVLSSSNAGSLVNFSAGTKDVWGDYPAGKAVTTDTLASPPAIGGTTAAAGTFTTLIGGGGSANYEQITGGATGKAVQFQSLGSDAAVSLAIQSKGTGAIDLAAGSSGVNISNGGTVTAITKTVSGSGYTSFPSVAISIPTTAGGVQATASVTDMSALGTAVVVSGGTGYTNGDVLTPVGGTGGASTRITVSAVSGGVITAAAISANSPYTVLPTNPVSVTGGTGSGATFNLNYAVTTITLGTAGSGYVEQPTVTFSGGGGSGAAAYATVGAEPTIKSLFGSTTAGLAIATAGGPQLRLLDIGDGTRPLLINGGSAAGAQIPGITANAVLAISAGGGNNVAFYTNGRVTTQQFQVSHTASAVNYVQVTGRATGNGPQISAQGSDAAINLEFLSKVNGAIKFFTGTSEQFRVPFTTGTIVNYATATGAIAGAGPIFSVAGTDADIDLNLTPKGAGNVRFGTYTVSALLAVAGYITIKDSGGTSRRLLVG